MLSRCKYFFGLALLLLVAGCVAGGGTPLQQAKGTWLLSFDETITQNPELQEMVNSDPDVATYLRESMENLSLLIDTDKNIMTILADGEIDTELPFTVVSETPEDNTLILNVNDEEFVLIIANDRLEWIERGESLVFVRVK